MIKLADLVPSSFEEGTSTCACGSISFSSTRGTLTCVNCKTKYTLESMPTGPLVYIGPPAIDTAAFGDLVGGILAQNLIDDDHSFESRTSEDMTVLNKLYIDDKEVVPAFSYFGWALYTGMVALGLLEALDDSIDQ